MRRTVRVFEACGTTGNPGLPQQTGALCTSYTMDIDKGKFLLFVSQKKRSLTNTLGSRHPAIVQDICPALPNVPFLEWRYNQPWALHLPRRDMGIG